MIEFIVEVLGEFLLQLVGEVLFELGLHTTKEPFRRKPSPWVAALGYTFFGLVVGVVLNFMFPLNFVPLQWRLANLVITPILVGYLMMQIGRLRAKRGDPVYRIDKFAYGYLFALAVALVRLLWTA
jgi:hypothetical protein